MARRGRKRMDLQKAIDRINRYDARLPKADRTTTAINALDWYVIRTHPQKEFAAQRILNARGFANIVPTETKYRKKTRYSKRKHAVEYPLMVGYVFIGFVPPPPWGLLFRLNVVQAVVGIRGEPVKIPCRAIEEIMDEHVSAPAEHQFMRTYHEYSVGDMVRLADHTYDKPMVVESITGRKAKVLMDMFGTTLHVEIDLDELVAA